MRITINYVKVATGRELTVDVDRGIKRADGHRYSAEREHHLLGAMQAIQRAPDRAEEIADAVLEETS